MEDEYLKKYLAYLEQKKKLRDQMLSLDDSFLGVKKEYQSLGADIRTIHKAISALKSEKQKSKLIELREKRKIKEIQELPIKEI